MMKRDKHSQFSDSGFGRNRSAKSIAFAIPAHISQTQINMILGFNTAKLYVGKDTMFFDTHIHIKIHFKHHIFIDTMYISNASFLGLLM